MDQKILKETYIQEFREDLKDFHEATKKFYKKEISVADYKKISGGFGSYAQRGGERSMLRLRLCGGEVNLSNLEFIANAMKKYEVDFAHLTTCQTIQLHDLTEEKVCNLVEDAFSHGIITRGGGGDYPRNVMCTPLSGVVEEQFDVLPYAKVAAEYLMTFINEVKLPRKLKVCFSNGTKNETHATFRDMGFVATSATTFDVYIAGGIGLKPKMGVLVDREVPKEKCLYYMKAMITIFTKYGNYENRGASRTRFLQDSLGVDELKRVFQEALKKAFQEDLDVKVKEDTICKTGDGEIEDERVIKQKQSGLYAVKYHPVSGILDASFFEKMFHSIQKMNDVKIRITPTQGMYVINLTAKEAKEILQLTSDGAVTEFEESTACIGADICQVGIGNSGELLRACIEKVRPQHFQNKVLPYIRISGCPSSCATHQVGVLSFRGGMKPDQDKKLHKAFAVFEGGCEVKAKENFATELGVMYQAVIPDFFVELGKSIQEKNLTFAKYRAEYEAEFLNLIDKYVNMQINA